jgi:UrcA family protein
MRRLNPSRRIRRRRVTPVTAIGNLVAKLAYPRKTTSAGEPAMNRSILALAAAVALCGAGAAANTPVERAPANLISYADLDLSNAYDADLLLNRLQGAARHVCGLDLAPRPLAERLAAEQCVNERVGSMVARIDAPVVTAQLAKRNISDTIVVAMQ